MSRKGIPDDRSFVIKGAIRDHEPGNWWTNQSDEMAGAGGPEWFDSDKAPYVFWLAKLKCRVGEGNNFVNDTLFDFEPVE